MCTVLSDRGATFDGKIEWKGDCVLNFITPFDLSGAETQGGWHSSVISSTCKGTFSAPSGGSRPNKYELFGLGDDAYLNPTGTSGELLSLPPGSE